jgi:hypothetical protein
MGWGRFFLLGDVGQQLDLQDRQRDVDDMRRQFSSQWSRDRSQDAQIKALRTETEELKLYVASLVKLLTRKGIVTQGEVEQIVDAVERSDSPAGG